MKKRWTLVYPKTAIKDSDQTVQADQSLMGTHANLYLCWTPAHVKVLILYHTE